MRSYHKGSAHVVVIIILVVALVGALGFVFYQNFIEKKEAVKADTTSTDADKTKNTPDRTTPSTDQPAPKVYTKSEADVLVADTYAKYIQSRQAGTSVQGALEGIKSNFTETAYTAIAGSTDVEGLTCAGNYVPDSVTLDTSVSGTTATSLVKRVFQGQTASVAITVTTDLSTLKITAVACPK